MAWTAHGSGNWNCGRTSSAPTSNPRSASTNPNRGSSDPNRTYVVAGSSLQSPIRNTERLEYYLEQLTPEQQARHIDMVRSAALLVGLGISTLSRGAESRIGAMNSVTREKRADD